MIFTIKDNSSQTLSTTSYPKKLKARCHHWDESLFLESQSSRFELKSNPNLEFNLYYLRSDLTKRNYAFPFSAHISCIGKEALDLQIWKTFKFRVFYLELRHFFQVLRNQLRVQSSEPCDYKLSPVHRGPNRLITKKLVRWLILPGATIEQRQLIF